MGWLNRNLMGGLGALALALLTASCSQQGQLLGQTPAEPPLPPGINVAFNHRDGARYRSPLTGQWRNGDNLEQLVIEAVETARSEILVAVQELALPEIASALVRAQERGVRVQVILENTYSTPWSDLHRADLAPHGRHRLEQLEALADRNHDGVLSAEERHNGDAVAILTRAGVPLIDDTEDGSKGSGLMHHKVVVIDRAPGDHRQRQLHQLGDAWRCRSHQHARQREPSAPDRKSGSGGGVCGGIRPDVGGWPRRSPGQPLRAWQRQRRCADGAGGRHPD